MQKGILQILQLLNLSCTLAVRSGSLEILDLLAHLLNDGIVALSLLRYRGVDGLKVMI